MFYQSGTSNWAFYPIILLLVCLCHFKKNNDEFHLSFPEVPKKKKGSTDYFVYLGLFPKYSLVLIRIYLVSKLMRRISQLMIIHNKLCFQNVSFKAAIICLFSAS